MAYGSFHAIAGFLCSTSARLDLDRAGLRALALGQRKFEYAVLHHGPDMLASASFRLLYVMIILTHDRRKIVRFDVTRHPTAGWLARQVTEAFPWDIAPRYLLRDRDASYGPEFCKRVDAMRIIEVLTAPRSPWQNAYVERVIGSIRRECLDYIVIFNERHLRRVLSSYVDYYHRTRMHLSLDKDCPDPRPVMPPRKGRVLAIPQVNGLHHRYERLAA